MALFGRKTARSAPRGGDLTYGDLNKPSLRNLTIPPLQLMQNQIDNAMVVMLAQTANENLLKALDGKTGGLSEALDELLRHFAGLLGELDEQHKAAVVVAPGLGYIIGMMENGSGSEIAGQSEQHYIMALTVAEASLPDKVTDSVYFDFMRDCGYYLARTRDASLQELCDIADKDVPWLEGGWKHDKGGP
jgi:hypothetical protein